MFFSKKKKELVVKIYRRANGIHEVSSSKFYKKIEGDYLKFLKEYSEKNNCDLKLIIYDKKGILDNKINIKKGEVV